MSPSRNAANKFVQYHAHMYIHKTIGNPVPKPICKDMRTVNIFEADIEDAENIVNVFNSTLGENFIDIKEVIKLLESRDSLVVVAKDVGAADVLGVGTAIYTPTASDLAYYFYDNFEKACDLSPEIRLGNAVLLKSIGVLENARGNGIGALITKHLVAWAEGINAESLYSLGWVDDKGCHIEKSFRYNNIKAMGELSHFWMRDSIEQKYLCPTCGNPCKCSAILFYRSLANIDTAN